MKSLSFFMMLVAIALGVVTFVQAEKITDLMGAPPVESLPMNMVTGVVKEVYGTWCLVQDSQDNEWKIEVDRYTDKTGHILPGVRITAMIEANGHAKVVKVLQGS
jgi:hypothetical protein